MGSASYSSLIICTILLVLFNCLQEYVNCQRKFNDYHRINHFGTTNQARNNSRKLVRYKEPLPPYSLNAIDFIEEESRTWLGGLVRQLEPCKFIINAKSYGGPMIFLTQIHFIASISNIFESNVTRQRAHSTCKSSWYVLPTFFEMSNKEYRGKGEAQRANAPDYLGRLGVTEMGLYRIQYFEEIVAPDFEDIKNEEIWDCYAWIYMKTNKTSSMFLQRVPVKLSTRIGRGEFRIIHLLKGPICPSDAAGAPVMCNNYKLTFIIVPDDPVDSDDDQCSFRFRAIHISHILPFIERKIPDWKTMFKKNEDKVIRRRTVNHRKANYYTS